MFNRGASEAGIQCMYWLSLHVGNQQVANTKIVNHLNRYAAFQELDVPSILDPFLYVGSMFDY